MSYSEQLLDAIQNHDFSQNKHLLKDALVNPLEDQLYDDAFHYFETIIHIIY